MCAMGLAGVLAHIHHILRVPFNSEPATSQQGFCHPHSRRPASVMIDPGLRSRIAMIAPFVSDDITRRMNYLYIYKKHFCTLFRQLSITTNYISSDIVSARLTTCRNQSSKRKPIRKMGNRKFSQCYNHERHAS